jgi:hypothetical protein
MLSTVSKIRSAFLRDLVTCVVHDIGIVAGRPNSDRRHPAIEAIGVAVTPDLIVGRGARPLNADEL